MHFDGYVWRVELPDRVRWIADCKPSVVNAIRVLVESFGFFRVEIEWVRADQKGGRRAALNRESGVNVVKFATPGTRVVARLVGLDVLREIVQLNVPARDNRLRGGVIFDVIRTKGRLAASDLHVSIGSENFARDVALLIRSDFHFSTRGRRLGKNLRWKARRSLRT